MPTSGRRQPTDLRVIDDPRQAAVLLDPLRHRLVRALQVEPASAAALAQRLGEPRQRLNYHLRELEAAGFVELAQERRKGNCVERVMRATAPRFLIDPAAGGVVEADAAALQDRYSATALIALAARSVREVARHRLGAERAGKRLATLSVDAVVNLASPADFAAFAADLGEAVAAVAARHHDGGASGGRGFRVVVSAYPAPAAEETRLIGRNGGVQ